MPKPLLRTAGQIEYELTRKRVKNLNLRIRANGSVAVSAPFFAPLAEIDGFVASRSGWIAAAQIRMAQKADQPVQALPSKEECLALFLPISEQVFPLFCQHLGGTPPEIAVRNMTSRWGSCHTQKRKITLASQLALMPRAAVEYVMVHEYCHFVHPNHQKEFWALVGSILPDYKQRRALLKNTR